MIKFNKILNFKTMNLFRQLNQKNPKANIYKNYSEK